MWEQQNLARIVRETNADLLFTPYQISPRIKGLKQVLMIRNMEPFLFRAYRYSMKSRLRNHVLRWQSSRALRAADRVIAISGFTEDWLLDGLGIHRDRIHRVYHGRDISFSLAGDPTEDRDRLAALGVEGDFLLTCGSFLPYRRYEDVIAAFDLCAGSRNSGIKLVIAGSGSDKRYGELIQRTIANSRYRDRILVVGYVSKGSMISLYRRCMVCIIAAEIEACPNIAIEAMSSGCAIVSSDRPPLPEMFSGNSLVFSAGDIEDMGDKIRVCLSDEPLRDEIGKGAALRAQDFSWKKCAEETYAALVKWPKN